MATLNLALRREDSNRMGTIHNTSAPTTYGGRMRSRVKTESPATYGGRVKYTARDGGAGELIMNSASFGPHGSGARVAFTIVDSCFGRILIATTRTGVCWIGLSDSDAHLEDELRGDLPAASCSRDNDGLVSIARNVVDFVGGRKSEIVVPVDFRATPFQLAVWQQLCAIPWGETRSYGEIARRLGRPDASRAVGAANGSNPLAIVIPCHRAVGADGSLTGYRWGLDYKRRLLTHERSLAQSEGPFRLTGQGNG
jgi:AraC family transcriptional regulator, regulatory protein of adaptative response / methylated-DNA-[protein]-cysteine methyltransferase